MKEIKGNFGTAKVFTDAIEPGALNQIKRITNHPIAAGARIRIMPDCHEGAGCVIGYTALLTDKVVPNLIGVDIGCGVVGRNLGPLKNLDYDGLDRFIRRNIPSSFEVKIGRAHV